MEKKDSEIFDYSDLEKSLQSLKIKSHEIKGGQFDLDEFFSVGGQYNQANIKELIDCIFANSRRSFIKSFTKAANINATLPEIKDSILEHLDKAKTRISSALKLKIETSIVKGQPFNLNSLSDEVKEILDIRQDQISSNNFFTGSADVFRYFNSCFESEFESKNLTKEIIFTLNLERGLPKSGNNDKLINAEGMKYLRLIYDFLILKNEITGTYTEFQSLFLCPKNLTSPFFFKKPSVLRGLIKIFNDLQFLNTPSIDSFEKLKNGKVSFFRVDKSDVDKKLDSLATNRSKPVKDSSILVLEEKLKKSIFQKTT